jgi:hypothetical protein
MLVADEVALDSQSRTSFLDRPNLAVFEFK